MDNYLSKLVDRALSREPVVKPRRAALFAPPPYAAGLLGRAAPALFSSQPNDEEADAETRQVEPNVQTARGAHDAETHTPFTQTRERHTHARSASDESELYPRPSVSTRPPSDADAARQSFRTSPERTITPPLLLTPTHARAQRVPAADLAPRESSMEPDETTNVREQTRPGPVVQTPRPDAALADSARAAEAKLAGLRARLNQGEEAARQFVDEVARVKSQARLHGEVEPAREERSPESFSPHADITRRRREQEERDGEAASAATRRREPAAPIMPQTVRTSAPLTPRRAPDEAPTNAPAPTIQVTIGRVEVRATNQPAPARQSSAQAPRLSLEEYMRRRSGGDR